MEAKGIRFYAVTATNNEHRKILTGMANRADEGAKKLAAMPAWAKQRAIDSRIPVSVKVEHDGLPVETWTDKSGKRYHRVTWEDGTRTQYEGDLSKNYVQWDR